MNVTVHGYTTEQTTGPYGDTNACDETLHVTVNGEELYIPITGIKKYAYDFYGSVPDTIDIDCLTVVDENIHGEAYHDDGELTEMMPVRETYELHYFEDPVEGGYDEIVWERTE